MTRPSRALHALTSVLRGGRHRQEALRAIAFRAVRGTASLVGVERDGIRYVVSTADVAVGRDTFVHGGYDAALMDRIVGLAEVATGRSPLLDGGTFVDVGANIGTTTIPAVVRYGAARVVAFEPVPETFRLLRCNVALNGVEDRVETFATAVSDEAGVVTMELSDRSSGDARVRRSGAAAEGSLGETTWATTQVPTTRLDDALSDAAVDLDDIRLVWVDTQGHEGHVLAGATRVTGRGIPMVVEYWPYGLRRAGGAELLHDLVAAAYTTFVDVRDGDPRHRPVSELPALASRYVGPGDYTDLLLLS